MSVPFDERSYQFNCGHDQKCLIPDEARTRVPPWVYGVVGLTLAAGELPVVWCRSELMVSNEHRFACLDQDSQESRDGKAGDVGGVL